MTFIDTVKNILASASNPMTPQEIRDLFKKNFPQYYGTPSHIRNVEKKHYKHFDHALLAQIYSQVRNNKFFYCDETQKPMRFSLIDSNFGYEAHHEVIARGENMFDYSKFPEYYKNYVWSGKHKLFGYPPDTFPEFRWITSLENRFSWVVNNYSANHSASKYLLQEMIEWGGSQNGILQKFNDASGEVNLFEVIQTVVNNLSDAAIAISSALQLPGIGLTYASKLLRFMQPEMYGALDSTIRNALYEEGKMPKIQDGVNKSMVSGYVAFVGLLQEIMDRLKEKGIRKPVCGPNDNDTWRASEIEMALFCWAGAKKSINH